MDSNEIRLRCSRCKVEKPEDEFHRHKTRRTGRHHYCKICHRRNPTPRPRRVASKTPADLILQEGHLWCTGCSSEKVIDAFVVNKRHRAGRANWCRACMKRLWQRPENLARRIERRDADWPYSLTIECRARARKRGLPFNITKEDLVVPEFCPVLGIRLQPRQGRLADNCPTVDRVNPAKGYVKGNVAVISWLANRLKSDCAEPAIFEAIATYMRRMMDGKAARRSRISGQATLSGVSRSQATLGLYSGAPTRGEDRSVHHGSD